MLASTPAPPYYAVIFTSLMKNHDDAYAQIAARMVNLAEEQKGFLGMDTARSGVGITVSYWKDLESIRNWKKHEEHLAAQEKGKRHWYQCYKVRICKVEREYGFGM
jgi:heme-degrading monooxygenase HmoA